MPNFVFLLGCALSAGLTLASTHNQKSPLNPEGTKHRCEICGWSSMSKGQGRIFNGQDAMQGQFPWRVSLFIGKIGQLTGGWGCSGTIIDAQWVLTAAHCFDNVISLEKSEFYAQVEYGNVERPSQAPLFWDVPGTDVFIHNGYNSKDLNRTFTNDIALIRIKQGFTFNQNTLPACLPHKFVERKYTSYATYASGWGAWKGSPGIYENPKVLQWAKFKVYDYVDCNSLMATLGGSYKVNSHQLCIKAENKDICEGDSGGSIDTADAFGRFYSLGIQSIRTGECNHSNNMSILTRIDRYLEWIESVTGLKGCSR